MVLDMTSVRKAKADLKHTGGLSDAEIAEEAEWVEGLRVI